jgi:DNA-binding PadR family transcriptional regulator
MSGGVGRSDAPAEGTKPLADERRQVLAALEGEALSGSAVFRRIRERSAEGEAAPGESGQSGDQSLLYPALHSLEAGWKIQARWQSDAGGTKHRTYRRRRLLPRRPAWTKRG